MSPQRIAAIWAQTRDGVIGRDGTMPWHVPEDFAHFKAETEGHPVIMGRRTWESFPARFRPLPGRTNIVITSRPSSVETGPAAGADSTAAAAGEPATSVVVAGSYHQAVALAADAPGGELTWVIGGGRLYRHAIEDPRHPVTRAVISLLDLETDGDTRAPELGPGWHLADDGEPRSSRTGIGWRVQVWQRSGPHHD